MKCFHEGYGPCLGPVEMRRPLVFNRDFPFCEYHAEASDQRERAARLKYGHGASEPVGFDPADAGERVRSEDS